MEGGDGAAAVAGPRARNRTRARARAKPSRPVVRACALRVDEQRERDFELWVLDGARGVRARVRRERMQARVGQAAARGPEPARDHGGRGAGALAAADAGQLARARAQAQACASPGPRHRPVYLGRLDDFGDGDCGPGGVVAYARSEQARVAWGGQRPSDESDCCA